MMKAGFWLSLAGILVIIALSWRLHHAAARQRSLAPKK